MDMIPLPPARPNSVAQRVQRLENDLGAARQTICHLQQATQEAERTVEQIQAQMLMYATDLHQMYGQERARMADLEGAVIDLLMGLVHIVEARDPYTGSHTARVALYAHAMALALGWNEEQLANLELGAQLHDVGKIGIADRILNKPGPLTAEEYREMQTHVAIGLRILGGVRVLSSILPYVSYHHERLDGRGYPFGLAGEAIPVEGRLLAVADAFDAITSERPYRAARSVEVGLAEVAAHRGTQFDPVMVDALQRAYDLGFLDVQLSRAWAGGQPGGSGGAVVRSWLKTTRKATDAPPLPASLRSGDQPAAC